MIAAAAVCTVVLGTFYIRLKKREKTKALACKALATFMPALLLLRAVPSVEQGAIPVSLFSWTLAALVFYIAADVLLECRFVLGAVIFSAGHLCMIIGFLTGGEVSGGSAGIILLTAFFVVAACFAVRRHIPHLKGKRLLLPAIAYVAVLSVMASLGVIAGLQTGNCIGMFSALGGVAFVVSDILLGMNRLGRKRSRARGAAVLILYYLAVYLLSMRVWW
ncbi:lysoplasmalogenase [Mediterraneibacter glycyrrhizinilyticus]|uniref:lysoplasmalogenase family protein n=1 Tax=Mediterraneibacter glycyrrhizinilyticus TaxID=342942 RepID=UPI00196085D3|nr:lysoplasmalogenase family protein [Mediterraneibacter glycyrrhizinilyticus]MBM6750284.1 lysoplasmalogenase [Mediterraneibacter glycyrrhizinilyticus]